MGKLKKKIAHPPEMAPDPGEPPGMERDSHGRPIPVAERLPEDRAKAKRKRTVKRRPK
jgi:hypothetical protein